jgi:hypothetical protein
VAEPSARFENYVALEVLSLVTFWRDHGFGNFDLSYLRNRSGQETDFLITKDNQLWLLLEVKLNQENIDKHNLEQASKLGGIPLVQIVYKNNVAKKTGDKSFVISASRFFS